jgi:hypothetical protein
MDIINKMNYKQNIILKGDNNNNIKYIIDDKENDKIKIEFNTKQHYMAWCYYYGFPIDDKIISAFNNI